MPRVPDIRTGVQPARMPTVQQSGRLPTAPTGQALERLGAGIASIGEAAARIGYDNRRLQNERDELAVVKAVNGSQEWLNNKNREVRDTYRGSNSVGATKYLEDSMATYYDEASKNLTERQKSIFDMHWQKMRVDSLGRMGNYESDQVYTARKTEAGSSMTNKLNAKLDEFDPNEVEKIGFAEWIKGYSLDISPEAMLVADNNVETEQRVLDANTSRLAISVMNLMLQDNTRTPEQLQSAYDQLKDFIPADQRKVFDRQIDGAKEQRHISAAMDDVVTNFATPPVGGKENLGIDPDNYDEAILYMREKYGNSSYYKKLNSEFDGYMAEQARITATMKRVNMRNAIVDVTSKPTYEERVQSLEKYRQDPQLYDSLRNAVNRTVATNPFILGQLKSTVASSDDDAFYSDIDREMNKGNLTAGDAAMLYASRDKWENDKRKDLVKRLSKEFQSYIPRVKGDKLEPGKIERERNWLPDATDKLPYKEHIDEINELLERIPDTNMTDQEIKDVFAKLFTKVNATTAALEWDKRYDIAMKEVSASMTERALERQRRSPIIPQGTEEQPQ